MQRHQVRQEDPLDSPVHADRSVDIQERGEEVLPLVGVSVCREHFGGGTGVAAVVHLGGDVSVDGPAELKVEDVAGDEPCEHEDSEGDVAARFIFEVFEDFGSLLSS